MTKNMEKMWFGNILLALFIRFTQPQNIVTLAPNIYYLTNYSVILLLIGFLLINFNLKWLKLPPIKFAFFIILFSFFLIPFAYYKYIAFRGSIQVFAFFPFMLSVVIVVNTVERLQKLVNTIMLILLFVAVRGIMLHKNGMFIGLGEFLDNPNGVSYLFSVMSPFCFLLYSYNKNLVKKIMYGFMFLLCVYMIIIAGSRAGFLAVICTVSLIWWYSPKKLMYGGLILLFAIYLVSRSVYTENMLTAVETNNEANTGRLELWTAAWEMFKDRPWGFGMRNTENVYDKYHHVEFYGMVNEGGVHSTFITFLSDLGIVGFSLFIILLLSIFSMLFKAKRKIKPIDKDTIFLKYFIMVSLIAICNFGLSALVETHNYNPLFWYLIAIISTIYHFIPKDKELNNYLTNEG